MKVCPLLLALSLLAVPAPALQEKPQEPAPQAPSTAYQKPEEKKPEEKKQDEKKPEEKKDEKKDEGAAAQGTPVSVEQLEQLVAPIALYPDALLAQLLMASTYPLEIVEAARWSQKNPKITGDKLEAALKEQTWDPSVKSMCAFPDVLKRMNENLDWTQDIGDAFLGQKSELMDTVQHMRRKAYDAGNLKSGKELTVTEQPDKIIVIESAQPEVIYVPTYYPTAVYGSWSYPYYYYPPLYPPAPPGGVYWGFAAGVFWGAAIWGGCSWGWGSTDVDIDINRQNNFIDRTENGSRRQEVKDRANSGAKDRAGNKAGNKGGWKHDPGHRKGVGYKDSKTAQNFGAAKGQTRVSKDQARGYGDRGAQRPSGGASAGTGARNTPSARPSTRPQTTPSRSASPSRTGQGSGSFSGSRSPSLDRASSSRGSASRGSSGSRGGSRGGGGRGGGRR